MAVHTASGLWTILMQVAALAAVTAQFVKVRRRRRREQAQNASRKVSPPPQPADRQGDGPTEPQRAPVSPLRDRSGDGVVDEPRDGAMKIVVETAKLRFEEIEVDFPLYLSADPPHDGAASEHMYRIEATGDMCEIVKHHNSASAALEMTKGRVDLQRGLGALVKRCRTAKIDDWQAMHDEALAFLKSMPR